MRPDNAPPTNTLLNQLGQRKTYLTSAEVTILLGKSRNALCRWVRIGIIPAFQSGKDYRFDPVALAGWIEAHQM
jgi:excisionase family DNA binding protein